MSDSKYEPLPEHIKGQLRKWYGEPPTPEVKSENRATQFVHKAQNDLAWLEHLMNNLVEEYEKEFGVKVVKVEKADPSIPSPRGRFKLIVQL